jgi:hypothetical protein|tara:strand:- start:123 stop:521 length:399 start_codon:yes stop_codon:yes gene_type:complete
MINFEQKRSELGLHCSALISDFHCFNDLDSYIELIENFLNYKIDTERFKTNFYEMRRLDCQKEYRWETMLYIINNLKLKQFQGLSSILSKLFTDLDVFEPNPLLRDNYEIGEEELRYFAKEALSKIKTYNDS